jgi:hypothetical protein
MTATAVQTANCGWCGQELDDDERENPWHRDGDELMCRQCYRDKFMYDCTFCEELEDEGSVPQHQFLVLYDPRDAGVQDLKPGIYRIIHKPYYTAGLVGSSWLHEGSLEFIRGLPRGKKEDPGGYPVGHICGACRKKHRLPKPLVNLKSS